MQQALITGSSGFIGGHLATALVQRGVQVKCLVRSTSRTDGLPRGAIELIHGDITSPESLRVAVQNCDTVFHLAGLVCALDYETLQHVNGTGTLNVAQACAESSDGPTLVAVSSIAASGPTRRGRVRREGDRATPISLYGRSKRAGELAALRFADRVPVTIVRPGMVFGPRDHEMLEVLLSIRRLRAHVVPGFVTPPLSLIHVADLVEILIRAAEHGKRCVARRENGGHPWKQISIDKPSPDSESANLEETASDPPYSGEAISPNASAANGHRSIRPGRQDVAAQGIYFGVAPEHPDYAGLGHLVRPMLHRPAAWLINMPSPLPWLIGGVAEIIAQIRQSPDVFNLDKIREGTAASWECSHHAAASELDYDFPYSLQERFQQTIEWYFDEGWL